MNAAGLWITGKPPPKIDHTRLYLAEIKATEETPTSVRVIWWETGIKRWEHWGSGWIADDEILRYARIYKGDDANDIHTV